MSAIIPFAAGSQLPAYMQNKAALAVINDDVATGPSFPVLSIKGKVFTLVSGKEKRLLTKPEDPDEVLQFINLAVLRANTKSRVYYAESYVEGDSEGAKPTCFSHDGVAPDASVGTPQAKKCQACPHAVWGSKVKDDGTPGEGTECTVNTRLAVADPDKLEEAILLRVPAGSRSNFAGAVEIAKKRGIPYNALVLKVGFDPTAPSPKLTFKPTGLLDDAAYAKVTEMYPSDMVLDVIGRVSAAREVASAVAAPADGADELDAAIAAKAVVAQAKAPAPAPAAPKPAAKAKPAAKPLAAPAEPEGDGLEAMMAEPVAAPAPAPVAPKAAAKPAAKPAAAAPAGDMDNLLIDLDNLLGMTDD